MLKTKLETKTRTNRPVLTYIMTVVYFAFLTNAKIISAVIRIDSTQPPRRFPIVPLIVLHKDFVFRVGIHLVYIVGILVSLLRKP